MTTEDFKHIDFTALYCCCCRYRLFFPIDEFAIAMSKESFLARWKFSHKGRGGKDSREVKENDGSMKDGAAASATLSPTPSTGMRSLL
jgi:hypothetical protein